MNVVERLEAIEQIKGLKARYFRCMDTKDWEGFADVFAPHAVMDMAAEVGASDDDPEAGITRGNTEIAAFVRAAVDDVVTVHHGHMPEIDITSPTTATGIWAMEDELRWPEDAPIEKMHGYGHYRETYELVGDRWLIATLTLTRLRVDFSLRDAQ
ncbi:MAG: nuclear transport factor 2 family protein [Acidimicrobiia bacterium]